MPNIFDSFRKGAEKTHPAEAPVKDEGFLEVLRTQSQLGCQFHIPTSQECEILGQHSFNVGLVGFHGEKLTLNPYALNRNLSLVAGTRTGKTSFIFRLVLHLSTFPDIGVICFDFKRDYERLVNKGFKVINASNLRINFLEYFGTTSLEAHCLALADLFADTFHLKDTRNLFFRTLLKLFKNGQPTLQDFRQELQTAKSGKGTGTPYDQLIKAQARINFLCDVLGETSRVRHGFAPHHHALDRLSITLDLGSSQAHALLVASTNQNLISYNLKNQIRPDRSRTILVADECSYILAPNRDFPSPVERFLPINGELGISYTGATQGRLSEAFNANVAHSFLLGTDDANVADIQLRSFGADHRQEIEGKLLLGSPGNAIAKFPEHSHLILVALEPPVHHSIPQATPDDIKASTATLLVEIDRYAKKKDLPVPVTPRKDEPKNQAMMPSAVALLKFSSENRLFATTECFAGAGLGMDQGDTALKFLVEQGLEQAKRCRLYKGRGRQPQLITPTRKGLEYLKTHHPDIKPCLLKGKGSLEHRVHVELLARYYTSQCFIVRKEHKDADLGVEDPKTGTWFAIEVVCHNTANLEHRISRNAEAGAQKTIIICSDKKSVKRLQKRLSTLAEVQDIKPYLLERGVRLFQPQNKGE